MFAVALFVFVIAAAAILADANALHLFLTARYFGI